MHPSRFHRGRHFAAVLLTLGLGLGFSQAVRADAPARVFVASTGDDANVGSPTSPKRNFQAAHDAVAAGGEIVVLNTAGYGHLAINKSVTVTVPPGVNGFVTVPAGVNGIDINANASDAVILRGLSIEGVGSGSGYGISGITVGTLRVEACTVRNFSVGVYFAGASAAHLVMNDSNVRDVGSGILAGSVGSSQTVTALITRCKVDNASFFGIDGFTGASSAITRVFVSECILTNNNTALVGASNGVFVYADNCVVSRNATGVTVSNGGKTFSRGNNTFSNNVSNGAFTFSLAAK